MEATRRKSQFKCYSYGFIRQKMAELLRKPKNDVSHNFLYRLRANRILSKYNESSPKGQNKLQKLPKGKELDSSSSLKEVSRIGYSPLKFEKEESKVVEAP